MVNKINTREELIEAVNEGRIIFADEYVRVRKGRSSKHYESLGYKEITIKRNIGSKNDYYYDVLVTDLPLSSHKKINVVCQHCNNETRLVRMADVTKVGNTMCQYHSQWGSSYKKSVIGDVYGRLTIVSERFNNGDTYVEVTCECGKLFVLHMVA